LEHFANDRRLIRVDLVFDPDPSISLKDANVVITVRLAARDKTTAGLVLKVFSRSLGCLLALQLGREIPCGAHEFLDRVVERDLFVREVITEPNTRIEKVLDHKTRTIYVTPKTGFIAADGNVKTLLFGCVQHRDEPGALLEFGSADRVVYEDVGWIKRPPLRFDVALALRDLNLKACFLVFVCASPCVDRRSHEEDPNSSFELDSRSIVLIFGFARRSAISKSARAEMKGVRSDATGSEATRSPTAAVRLLLAF
jgi:hypothetical protein